jgi:hypothetical protein
MSTPPNDCAVCLEPLTLFKRGLTCGHEFHEACLSLWLIKSNTCPLCRKRVGPITHLPIESFQAVLQSLDIAESGLIFDGIMQNWYEKAICQIISLLDGHDGVKYSLIMPAEKGRQTELVVARLWADYVSAGTDSWLRCCSAYQSFYICPSSDRVRVDCVFFKNAIRAELMGTVLTAYIIDWPLMYKNGRYKSLDKV